MGPRASLETEARGKILYDSIYRDASCRSAGQEIPLHLTNRKYAHNVSAKRAPCSLLPRHGNYSGCGS
jgi:hypothetical protein